VLGTTTTAQNVLGDTGMPTLGADLPPGRPAQYQPAFAALCDWLDGIGTPAPVLALGPLTNLAAVLLARPDLAEKISRLLWMGGSAGPGNHTASAEFNAFCDPEAVAIVLASGVDFVMVDLECCRKVLVGPDDLAPLKARPGQRARVLHDLFGGYVDIGLSRGRSAMALYDPVAAALAADSTLAELRPVRIEMELAGSHTRGRTVVDARPGAVANARVATEPKAEAIRRFALDALAKAAEAEPHVA
jgi:inosine-uridine nucleoside N-ribohydrolase